MTTCDNQRVPRPATGKTPVRNVRIPDEDWFPLVAKAEMEGRTASDALAESARRYVADAAATGYEFTYANWPDAGAWAPAHFTALTALGEELQRRDRLPAAPVARDSGVARHHPPRGRPRAAEARHHRAHPAPRAGSGACARRLAGQVPGQQAPVRDRPGDPRAAPATRTRRLAAPAIAGRPGSPGRPAAFRDGTSSAVVPAACGRRRQPMTADGSPNCRPAGMPGVAILVARAPLKIYRFTACPRPASPGAAGPRLASLGAAGPGAAVPRGTAPWSAPRTGRRTGCRRSRRGRRSQRGR